MATKRLPVFQNKNAEQAKRAEQNVDDELRSLGIEISKSLPTYDVPLRLISPNENNPNEMDDSTFNRLVKEIEETGFVSPIQIVPAQGGKYKIIGGEHRWNAAKILGWEKIPCNILVDEKFLDPDLRELLTVRLNVIQGKLNPEKFLKLYKRHAQKYGVDQLKSLFGFTETDAWAKLTKGVEQAVADTGIGGKQLLQELAKRSRKTKTVDGLGKTLKDLFKQYGSDLKHSFMVFVYGGKRHLYVTLDDGTFSSLEKMIDTCRRKNLDINRILNKILLLPIDSLDLGESDGGN